MSLNELLLDLGRKGLQLRLDGENLRVLGTKGALTPELRNRLAGHKAALVELLSASSGAEAEPLPAIVPVPESRHEPFPLTDIQEAYWFGRGELVGWGGVSTHYYAEFDCLELDVDRLQSSLNDVIVRHDMLRAIIRADGRQQILPEVEEYLIRRQDLSALAGEAAEAALLAFRDEMSHQMFEAERWPLFDVRLSLLGGGAMRLHVSVDLLIADFQSLSQIFGEWARGYHQGWKPADRPLLSIRDYVLAEKALETSALWDKARDYWRQRLARLPDAPELPLAHHAREAPPRFSRWSEELEAPAWEAIKARAAKRGVSPSAILLAAFSLVLARWSSARHFSVTLTQFNRLPLHPDVDRLVGDFTAALLAEVSLDQANSFADFAQNLQARLLKDLEHSLYSAVRVIRDIRASGRWGTRALFPVVFTSALPLSGRGGEGESFDAFGPEVFGISQTPQVWIDHVVTQVEGRLAYRWDVRDGVFPPMLVDDMFEQYRHLLHRLAEDPASWDEIGRVGPAVADLAERAAANDTAAELPRPVLHELFEAAAAARPAAPAVIAGEESVTYGQLREAADALARRLRAAGIGNGSLVVVASAPGWRQIAAVLAVLKAGAAFVPLSSAWPPARRREVLALSGAEAVMVDEAAAADQWVPPGMPRFDVAEPADEGLPELEPPRVRPDDCAYVIFTSGSTGEPKGVTIEHGAAVNTLLDINARFGIGPDDRVLAISDLAFDLSIYDLFGTFAAGGCIVVVEEQRHGRRNAAYWAELIAKHRVTVWNSVPALMGLITEFLTEHPDSALDSLRVVMMSGDWIPVTLPDEIRRHAPAARIYSLGGATEASIWSIYFPVEAVDPDWHSIPYGWPLANQRMHVLDDDLEPCPRYVPGELYIAGAGLARGYWERADLTAASFIIHPRTGERLYRTGDLGRYLPGGLIEFLGRRDSQVKIGGFRIELEEIEAKLVSLPDVTAAAAEVVPDEAGRRHIRAAVVLAAGSGSEPSGIGAAVGEILPSYMMPTSIVPLSSLPLSSNGKIDRSALREILGARARAQAASAGGATHRASEAALAAIVTEVLGRDAVDPTANFFELGATSIDLVRVHAEVQRRLGLELEPIELFEHSSIRALAEHLSGRWQAARPAADSGKRDRRIAHQAARRNVRNRRDGQIRGRADER